MIHQIQNPDYRYIVEEGTTGTFLSVPLNAIVSNPLEASTFVSKATAKAGITKHNNLVKYATWMNLQPIKNPQIKKFAIKSWEII